jgi:integrase
MASPHKHPKTSVFYFRRAVPQELREALGRAEYKKSLGTKDPKQAKLLFAAAWEECEAVFARAKAGKGTVDVLDDEEVRQIADAWAAHVLQEDDDLRFDGLSERDYAKQQETFDIVVPSLRADLARGFVADDTAWEFDDFLKSHGFNVPSDSPDFRRVCLAMQRSWVRALEIEQKRHHGEPIDTPKAPTIGPKRVLGVTAGDPTKLSGAFNDWRRERNPSEKVWSEWSLALRRFVEVNGDVAVATLDRTHMRKFKEALLALKLSQSSIKKHLSALKSVLSWAVENGLCENNVAAGIRVRDAKVQPEARLAYEDADLKVLFSSRVYVDGHRPLAGGGEAAFWLPLMALYMGCRLEELGQALVSDVSTRDGVVCLDINDRGEGKSVKAVASRRLVPVHPELLRLGFDAYLASVKSDGRLFPALKADQFGKWTGNFSKWWGRWARGLGVQDRRKVFHSFRHSFKLGCRRARIEEEIHDRLTGHSGGVGRGYGGAAGNAGELVTTLAEAIGKVRYSADLSAVPAWVKNG